MNLCSVELYSFGGSLKATFQTGVGDFVGCEFTLAVSGPRDFALKFAAYQNIIRNDIIKIRLYSSTDYFFTGVVMRVPVEGRSHEDFTYSGYGFVDYLQKVNSDTQAYTSDTISTIISHLLDNIVIPATPIVKDAGKINPPAITITSLSSNQKPVSNVMDALKNIASSDGDYIYGVDETGDFFFDEKSSTLMVTLTVGATGDYGIPAYDPEETDEPVSKIWLKDKDGTPITTLSNSDVSGINEIDVTAPDIDDTSAELWAAGILAKRSAITRRATIEWPIESSSPILLKADGTIRVISNIPPTASSSDYDSDYGEGNYGSGLYGGALYTGYNLDDTLDVVQVTYIINESQGVRKIELGSLPVNLNDEIMKVYRDLVDLKISLGR